MSDADAALGLLDRLSELWERIRTFGGSDRRSDTVLAPRNRRFKKKLLAIDSQSAQETSAIDSEALTRNIIALFDDPSFAQLDCNDRAWIFAQIQHIYAKTGHSSGLRIIPSAERQLAILADEAQPIHLTALCTAYDLLYFLYWCWNNDIDAQRGFADNVVRPFAAAIRRDYPTSTRQRAPVRETPVVGLLAQFLSPTPGNALATANQLVLRSVIASGFKPVLFAWAQHDPETLTKIEALGVEIHAFTQNATTNSIIDCVRDTETIIRKVDPDILITEMNSALPTVLYERRVAKIQIFYQLGLPYWPLANLDAILNSWGVDPGKLEMVAERCFSLPTPFNLPEYAKEIDPALIRSERDKFPPGRLIGSYGRISKVTPDYIRTAAAIVDGIEGVTVLLGGPGDAGPARRAVEETGLADRFIVVEGFVDGQLWGYLLDFFLDTYPQPSGLAVMEMTAKGKPTVYMEDPDVPNFTAFKVGELTARDPETYVRIARRLLTDDDFCEQMRAATRSLSTDRPNEADYAEAMGHALTASISRYEQERTRLG